MIIRKVRGNAGRLPNVELDKSLQFRNNSSTPVAKADQYFAQAQVDPMLKDAVSRSPKVNRFEELLITAHEVNHTHSKDLGRKYFETIDFLFRMIKDDLVKDQVSRANILEYANLLNRSTYQNRTTRLSLRRNRDSDQYSNNTLNNDVMLKSAIIDLSQSIAEGRFKAILDDKTVRAVLMAMYQYQMYPEMVLLWESGVNDNEVSDLYLGERVLGIILPVAFNEGNIKYEDVLKIYEENTKNVVTVDHELLCGMGKIAINAGDYTRGLDFLESLLSIYEKDRTSSLRQVARSLSELHLTFIGSCKDIKIAHHFFDKVVDGQLPYYVILKAPHVLQLFENCFEAKESLDTLLYFWKRTVQHYSKEQGKASLNSRYTILHNLFFKQFFRLLPTLNESSYNRLKEVISIYASIKDVDELFLNTIISNYAWNDKVVFEQLVDNYAMHKVRKTCVAYRVILKRLGKIEGYTSSEIIVHWNELLLNLNGQFSYIPIADWAALRDATIASRFREQREELYLALLNAYRDFHQDPRACIRFAKYWINRPEFVKLVARISLEDNPTFNIDFDIVVPTFLTLRQNVDYKEVTAPLFETIDLEIGSDPVSYSEREDSASSAPDSSVTEEATESAQTVETETVEASQATDATEVADDSPVVIASDASNVSTADGTPVIETTEAEISSEQEPETKDGTETEESKDELKK